MRYNRRMDENGNKITGNEDKLALASLVCGITSIFIFPLAFGTAAIIFGLITQDRVERDSREWQNARLGIIFGIIGLVLWVVALAAYNYIGFDMNSLGGGTSQQPSAF